MGRDWRLEHQTDSSPGTLNEWLSHSAKGVHGHRRPSQSAVCIQRKETGCLIMDGFLLKEV